MSVDSSFSERGSFLASSDLRGSIEGLTADSGRKLTPRKEDKNNA
jgi:hypothetical protein